MRRPVAIRSSCPVWQIFWTLIFALWTRPASVAQGNLTVSDFHLDASGRAHLRVPFTVGFYYILYRGDEVASIRGPADVEATAENGAQVELIDDLPPFTSSARFYRVEQLPVGTPKDVDGDGLDDPYELSHRPFLNPLDPADAARDPDNDGRTTLQEYLARTNPFVAEAPPPPAAPVFVPPTDATTGSFLTLTGTGPANTYVRVEGGGAVATNRVSPDGMFELMIPLNQNRLNRLFVTAVNGLGETSPGRPFEVLQDSQPPTLFIDFPTNGMTMTVEKVMVAGRVGDSLSGYRGLSVWVHSAPSEGEAPLATTQFPINSPFSATVDVGIGPNGTYERGDVPLVEGANTITVMAADLLGNRILRRAEVIRQPLVGARLLAVSGDRQVTNALQRLRQPLVVHVQQSDGTPLANTLLLFEVTRSDGRLLPVDSSQLAADWSTSPSATANGAMKLQLKTDSVGEARIWWTLGSDAGGANNRVCVSSGTLGNSVFFCASAIGHPARQINIGSGNNQKVEAGAPISEPLRVWVSDGLNPVPGTPITFRVIRGGGKLSPGGRDGTASVPNGTTANELVVTTGLTGHASAGFIAGSGGGQNVIETSFPGQFGLPATFLIYGVARDPGQPGSFTGVVLDNTSCPIGDAYCELNVADVKLGTRSDRQGRFRFDNVPGGMGHLFVNGATATSVFTNAIPTNSFPSLSYSVVTVPNAENSLPTPVLLPRQNPKNAHTYSGTNDLVLTCEGIEGLKMTIKANSMSFSDGTLVTPQRPAVVSLNQVHHDDIPMPMPDGVAPSFAWTLQPGGARFKAETPVEIVYPNMSGLAPGSVAYFLSFNHDTERFEIVASGHVTEDGAKIVTDPESGLTISGWGCNCPPYSVTGDCGSCESAAVQLQTLKVKDEPPDCPNCETTVPAALPFLDFTPVDPGVCDDARPCNLGCTTPLFPPRQPKISVYCDPNAGLWRNKVVAAYFEIRQHIDLKQFTDLTDALVKTTTDCAELKRMSLDMLDWVNGQFDCSQVGQRKVYCTLKFVQTHENAHVMHHIDRIVPAFDVLQDSIENLTVPMDDYATAEAAETAIQESDGFINALQKFNEVIQQSIIDERAAEPLNDPQIIDVATEVGRMAEARRLELGCPPGPFLAAPPVHGTPASADLALAENDQRLPNSARPSPVLASLESASSLDHSWLISVNGQSVTANTTRYFNISNIAAVDVFGEAPGSVPDFVGDDLVRVVAVSSARGANRYASSGFFRIRQGARAQAPPLSITDVPPRAPESLRAVLGSSLLTALGTTTQLRVIATYPDGATEELNSADLGTTFRVSNPAVVTVDSKGKVTAVRNGHAIVTASNQGATSTAEIDVAPGSAITTVRGIVRNADGTPATDVTVSLTGLATPAVATDANGGFTIQGAPTAFGSISVIARIQSPQGRLFAAILGLLPVENSTTDAGILKLVAVPAPPRFLAGGQLHALATRRDGTLWAWGDNSEGQLGDGTRTGRLSPVRIGTGTDWAGLTSGQRHNLALQVNGSLWAWGQNRRSQLGDGTTENRLEPRQVGTSTDWGWITTGADHSLALRLDGSLWAWGANEFGQLGDGTLQDGLQPVRILQGTVWRSVAGGRGHTLAVRSDGTLWSWGHNHRFQLGDGTFETRGEPRQVGTGTDWEFVAAGGESSFGLKTDGSLWAWGINTLGQLGLGDETTRTAPSRVGVDSDWWFVTCSGGHTVGIKLDATLWTWGSNTEGEVADLPQTEILLPTRIPGADPWLGAIAPTLGGFTVGVDRDRTLLTWGYNNAGQLGIGRTGQSRLAPTRVGEATWEAFAAGHFRSSAVSHTAEVHSWGRYPIGDGSLLGRVVPTPIPSQVNPLSLAVGSHTLVVAPDGTLWGWGDNFEGQVGQGTSRDSVLTPVRIGQRSDWRQVDGSAGHSLAIASDGTMWAWGQNTFGELGIGTTVPAFSPVLVNGLMPGLLMVSAGEGSSIAVRSDGTLWSWGRNTDGQLGDGTTTDHPQPIQIGADTDWRSVAAGGSHVLALKADGSLWGWGRNGENQLGDGTRTSRLSPTRNSSLPNVRLLAAGFQHSLAVKADGTLWAWGRNGDAQLGDGTTSNRSQPIQVGTDTDWVAVSAGTSHTLARKADGSLWAWGSNDLGELGTTRRHPVGSGADWGSKAPALLNFFYRESRLRP